MDADLIRQILAALEREGVDYKVFGAIALITHGLPRATQDLDIFVAPVAENIARLRRALKSVFNEDPNVDEITYEDLSGAYPAIQYVAPDGSFSIDILARLGEAYDFDSLSAVRSTWQDVPITVVSPRQLYEMKRETIRWKDRQDAAHLKERFELEDD